MLPRYTALKAPAPILTVGEMSCQSMVGRNCPPATLMRR